MIAPWFTEALYDFTLALAENALRPGVRRIELTHDFGLSVGIAPGTSVRVHTAVGEVEVAVKLDAKNCPLCGKASKTHATINGVPIVGCECVDRCFPGRDMVAVTCTTRAMFPLYPRAFKVVKQDPPGFPGYEMVRHDKARERDPGDEG